VISEIMPNPKLTGAATSEATLEWFEITNAGTASFDLNGLGLDRQNDTRAPDPVNSAACKPLAPGTFALFARSTDVTKNGMLPIPDATFGFSMINAGNATTKADVQVVDIESCTGIDCTTVYDIVEYGTPNGWPSSMATADGVSAQLAPGMFTTTANDAFANFCPGIAGYGDLANLGTPKAANACM
jgi:hypothetical protein